MAWQKVSEQLTPTWDYKKQREIEGIYKSKQEKIGPNNSNLYDLETKEGSIVSIWGNTVLDIRLKNCSTGDLIKLVYLGLKKSEKTGRTFHNFEVYIDKEEESPFS